MRRCKEKAHVPQTSEPVDRGQTTKSSLGTPQGRLRATGIAQLLSASSLAALTVHPLLSPAAATNSTPSGYTPAQIQQVYGFSQVTLANGVKGNGSGQTIAIVHAYDDPNIASDLKVFDKQFGLSDPSFTKVNLGGQADAGWSEEIALDVEWAHAVRQARISCWSRRNLPA